jgi:hypothetical protein
MEFYRTDVRGARAARHRDQQKGEQKASIWSARTSPQTKGQFQTAPNGYELALRVDPGASLLDVGVP